VTLLPVSAPTPSTTSGSTSTGGCTPTWATYENRNSIDGDVQRGVSTVEACRAACLADQRCVAIDWADAGSDHCWLHRQLNGPYGSPGVTQHVLVARCETTSGMTSSSALLR